MLKALLCANGCASACSAAKKILPHQPTNPPLPLFSQLISTQKTLMPRGMNQNTRHLKPRLPSRKNKIPRQTLLPTHSRRRLNPWKAKLSLRVRLPEPRTAIADAVAVVAVVAADASKP
jgi:hypothetical protein